jgi:hypothetical protein
MIDADLAAFLQDGVGIHIGTRNQHLEPNGARAISVKVEDDGRHFLLYLSKVAAQRVLPDLEANGQAAIVFARPVDERACQVKALFVSSRATRPPERTSAHAQWDAFLQNLEHIGIPRASARGWLRTPQIAIRLKATAVFEQTPGPDAGKALA